jgi:hypothetical protein
MMRRAVRGPNTGYEKIFFKAPIWEYAFAQPALPTPEPSSFWTRSGIPDLDIIFRGNTMTTTLSVMIAIWGLIVIAFMALLVYRAHLTESESDQLFLNETVPNHLHQEQDEMVRRLANLAPILKGVGAAAILMTIAVLWVLGVHLFSNANL